MRNEGRGRRKNVSRELSSISKSFGSTNNDLFFFSKISQNTEIHLMFMQLKMYNPHFFLFPQLNYMYSRISSSPYTQFSSSFISLCYYVYLETWENQREKFPAFCISSFYYWHGRWKQTVEQKALKIKKNKKGKKETLGFYFLFPLKKQDMFSGELVYYQKFCWMENCSH